MRLNQYIAQNTGLSRRAADKAIEEDRVYINGQLARLGQPVQDQDTVALDGRTITPAVKTTTIMLNKPVGYVCSRAGQGSKTIYELLPKELHHLKPVGRLDKDSSGLILLTNDGQLANQLTHPRYQKTKTYQVRLDRSLSDQDLAKLTQGIMLEDGISKLDVRVMSQESGGMSKNTQHEAIHDSYLITNNSAYEVRMSEGRNRQIRRTFEALGYKAIHLHRTHFGDYTLDDLTLGNYRKVGT